MSTFTEALKTIEAEYGVALKWTSTGGGNSAIEATLESGHRVWMSDGNGEALSDSYPVIDGLTVAVYAADEDYVGGVWTLENDDPALLPTMFGRALELLRSGKSFGETFAN